MIKFQLIYSIKSYYPLHGVQVNQFTHDFRSWTLRGAMNVARKYIDEMKGSEARMMGGRLASQKLCIQLPLISRYFRISVLSFN